MKERTVKVTHLIETLELGGTELSLLQILPRLRTTQPVLCHVFRGESLAASFRSAGVPVFSLDISTDIPRRYRFAAAVSRFLRFARREKPDLIVTSLFTANLIGRLVGRRLNIPVVSCFVSESYADVRWQTLSPPARLKLWGFRALDRFSAPWASHFIANSEAVKVSESRSLRVPLDKVTVIHRGRDPRVFAGALSDSEIAGFRVSLGMPAEGPIILNIGRLVESKGQHELIRAFADVLSACPEARLLIAGDGPYRRELEGCVNSLGLERAVHLLGRRDDVPRLLALADVFAFPSRYEGHPGAVIEAMLAGKPVLVSDIAVHRETVEPGVSGIAVPVGDPGGIAKGLVKLLRDEESSRSMGSRAREAAVRRFDIANVAEQHDHLYQRLAANGSAL